MVIGFTKDGQIQKPLLNKKGLSDPVLINTSDGQVCVAWFDKRDGYWHDEYGNTFGDVRRWIELPPDFRINYELYGGEE